MEKTKEQEFLKELRRLEKRNKELVEQVNDDQSKLITLTDAYEKLYEKTKKYKTQIEAAVRCYKLINGHLKRKANYLNAFLGRTSGGECYKVQTLTT